MSLPTELVEKILQNLKFEQVIRLSGYIAKKLYDPTTRAMNWAAQNGCLSTIIWLHNNRQEGCTTDAMDYAAKYGHLNIIIWLHNNGKNCTTRAMNWAAENGHLEVVKWLHKNRQEGCTFTAMDRATSNGHLEVLKYLRISLRVTPINQLIIDFQTSCSCRYS